MSDACHAMSLDAGLVRDILGSVDCNVQVYAAAGYQALTGPTSPLPAALTAMLTIYVVLLGYRMLFAVGSTRLAETPTIALKIGMILAVTLNWSVFQTLVFNVDSAAPLQIGRLISQPMTHGGARLASNPLTGIQIAYDELTADAAQLARKGAASANGQVGGGLAVTTPEEDDASTSAAGLRRAASALVASTVGILAMAFIAVGVLTAVGPIFIALFLFEATRGFFVGWVRALVAAMVTPMVCWIATSLMLVVLSPRVALLAEQRASQLIQRDTADAASAIVLIFAASQVAMIVGGLLIANGFELRTRAAVAGPQQNGAQVPEGGGASVDIRSRAQALASTLERTSAVYSREYAGGVAAADTNSWNGDRADAAGPKTGTPRLGETYRRDAALRDPGRYNRGAAA